eukprot:5178850-Pyramimonas_sp.AAC.1
MASSKETRGRKRTRDPEPPPLPWDQESDPSDCECGPDPGEMDAAAGEFIHELVELYLLGKPMNARHFCVLCYYASKAGIKKAGQFA